MSGRLSRQKAVTAAFLGALVAVMVGLSFAAVPLYRIFCQVTGFEGTTQRAAAAPGQVASRVITVRFNADTDPALPWRFEPAQTALKVKVGEEATAFYRAKNLARESVVGQAVFNVTPLKAGLYFDKIQCFCFTEQTLKAGQGVDMPVQFFVDPAMLKDADMKGIDSITLSYTFFRAADAGAATDASLKVSGQPAANTAVTPN